MKRFVPVLLLLAFAAPSRAGLPASRAQTLLVLSPTESALRERLAAYADSAAPTDRLGAGEALYLRGVSFARSGLRDSAIVSWRRAVELRGDRDEHLALVDALLQRRAPGDVDGAIERLVALEKQARISDPGVHDMVQGRLAWARFLAGQPDSALALFKPVADRLSLRPEWRYRMAKVHLATGDRPTGGDLLIPNAILSRGTDQDVVQLLDQLGRDYHAEQSVEREVLQGMQRRDVLEKALADSLHGKRVRFPASDRFSLGGLLIHPGGATRRRAAVVVVAPGDTLALYDSLAVALRRHGFAVALLEPRGSGWSVGPSVPSRESWDGREAELEHRVALDVRDALRALARVGPVDTTRYLVVGTGTTTSIAVQAAEADRRVAALLLLSPTPPPVERGITRARLAKLSIPVWFQIAPEDYTASFEITDALYQAGNRAASRVGDARGRGRGAAQFRSDATIAPRITQWLDGVLVRPSPRATPPPSRRRG